MCLIDGAAKLFPKAVVPAHIPTSSIPESQCLHTLSILSIVSPINFSHFSGSRVSVAVLFYISLITCKIVHLFMCLLAIVNLL